MGYGFEEIHAEFEVLNDLAIEACEGMITLLRCGLEERVIGLSYCGDVRAFVMAEGGDGVFLVGGEVSFEKVEKFIVV